MIEGPGHIPMHLVEMNVKKEREVCHEAPFYVLGPLVTDIAPGYDHITSRHRRGFGRRGRGGHALLRDAEGTSRLARQGRRAARGHRLQDRRPRRRHRRGRKNVRNRDESFRRPASSSTGIEQFELSLDPETARAMHDETLPQDVFKCAKFCSMCGPKFCSMRVTQDIRKLAADAKKLSLELATV